MILDWLRRRRRRRLLAAPIPAEWEAHLATHVPHYVRLSAAEKKRLADDARVFIAERAWEGCRGLVLTEEIQVSIAGQACLLTLGFPEGPDLFRQVKSILVYKTGFVAPDRAHLGNGFQLHGEAEHLGEAWHRGPVILSWEDARGGGTYAGDGRNLVLHEFAHVLDMLQGDSADGVPPLADRKLAERWRQVMAAEIRKLHRAIERGRETLLDEYGAESETEFFAVATECFFDAPDETRAEYPELYEVLRDTYRQDPAAR